MTLLDKANSTGNYTQPFKTNSFLMNAVIDKNITFEEYVSNDNRWYAQEWNGKRYKYNLNEMQSTWKCVEIQRTIFKAALLVYDGQFIAINPALRSLGYNI